MMEECNHKSGSEGGVCKGCGHSFEHLFNQLRAEVEALKADKAELLAFRDAAEQIADNARRIAKHQTKGVDDGE